MDTQKKGADLMKKLVVCVFLSAWMAMVSVTVAHADMKLKVAVVNPSATQEQTAPVRYDLPKGIGPAEIVDIGDMELKYDSGTKKYYVFQSVLLKPSEKKVLEISIKDIWQIPEKDMSDLRDHTQVLNKSLEQTQHSQIGAQLAESITSKVSLIADAQSRATLGATAKMNLYYTNLKIIASVKEDIGMLENLVLDAGGTVEERFSVPKTGAVYVEGAQVPSGDVIELMIKAKNPSQTAKQLTPVRYELPGEVRPEDLADAAGFDVIYDFKKECFALTQSAVELEPGETKNFVIRIRDIWNIPDEVIGPQRAHTQNLLRALQGGKFTKQAEILSDSIMMGLDQIVKTQSVKNSGSEHIAAYQTNMESFTRVKQLISELEKLVVQSGAKPVVTVWKDGKAQPGKAEMKTSRGDDGVPFVSRALFKGKTTFSVNTWKIIFTILCFLGIMSAVFFYVWSRQLKD